MINDDRKRVVFKEKKRKKKKKHVGGRGCKVKKSFFFIFREGLYGVSVSLDFLLREGGIHLGGGKG